MREYVGVMRYLLPPDARWPEAVAVVEEGAFAPAAGGPGGRAVADAVLAAARSE